LGKKIVAKKPELIIGPEFHYCPGCSHGILHRLLAEIVEEMKIRQEVIGVASVGCAARMPTYLDFDFVKASHGRAPAVASGVRRELPEHYVFTYQGDGDLLAIGLGEGLNAAIRGENILIMLINNAIYGMTGGQMAPTTLIGQWTTTTPRGRQVTGTGYPLRYLEMVAQLPGVILATRCAVDSPRNIRITKNTIKKALSLQKTNPGLALVEILGICPTNLHRSPAEALIWLRENMFSYYPLGVIKKPDGVNFDAE
jgi:2-oxoglutarate ferredoxin oxidoreductase subunit beta